jgi:hypothetical protein
MTYPNVINELETLQKILQGYSISRYGDGEFALANGRNCVSQEFDCKLQKELQDILQSGTTDKCLVAIPPLNDPRLLKSHYWLKGKRKESYSKFLNIKSTYYSSFVSRPDNITGLHNKEYYDMYKSIWSGKDIILITSLSEYSTPESFKAAKSIDVITGPRQHAYSDIDLIEKRVGYTDKLVLICMGACATVLAWRLSLKNIQSIDVGHIGTFMYGFEHGDIDVLNRPASKPNK